MIEANCSEINADGFTTELRTRVREEEFAPPDIEDDPVVVVHPATTSSTQPSREWAAEAFPTDFPEESERVSSPATQLPLLQPLTQPPTLPPPVDIPPPEKLPPPVEIPPLGLQPEFVPNPDDRYHINDLLRYHDRHFVENAYLATLKRPADASELAEDLDRLRSGRLSKVDLIERLLLSLEGRRAKVEVSGRGSSVAKRLNHIPVLGYLLRFAKGLLRLPVMMQHQQQFELYALAQQQSIADYINEAVNRITEQRRETYRALTEHQRETYEAFVEYRRETYEAFTEYQRETYKLIAELSETYGMLAEALAEVSTSSQVSAELPMEVASLRRQLNDLTSAQQSVTEMNRQLLIHEQNVIVETQKTVQIELRRRFDELRHRQQQLSADLKSQEQLTLLLLDKVRRPAAKSANH